MEQLPTNGKVAFYGSLIYTFSPIDLLPDPVLLDDIGVLAAALIYIGKLADKLRAEGAVGRPGQVGHESWPAQELPPRSPS